MIVPNVFTAHDTALVPTSDLARMINLYISAGKSEVPINQHERTHTAQQLSMDLGHFRGLTETAAYRRLYSICYLETTLTPFHTADAILLSMGRFISQEPIPVFPATLPAAREMAEIWAEDWSDEDKETLAQNLRNFTRGYFAEEWPQKTIDRIRKLSEKTK